MLSSRLFSLWTPARLAVDYPVYPKTVWRGGNFMFQTWGVVSWAVPVYFLWDFFKIQGWIGSVIFLFVSQILQLFIFIFSIKGRAVPYQKYPDFSSEFKKNLHEYLQGQGLSDEEVGVLQNSGMGPNAFATGLFGYRQIVVTEELIHGYADPTNPNFTLKLGENTIEAIIAHEVGHIRNHHIEKSILVGTILASIVTAVVYNLFAVDPFRYLLFPTGVSQQILLYWGESLFNVMLLYPLTFLMLYRSRSNEYEADSHLLETNGCKNGQDFFHQIRHIAPVPNLPLWHSCNMTHPDPYEREQRMIEWSEQHCRPSSPKTN
jgi:Zn-dependent protease with chaperone function